MRKNQLIRKIIASVMLFVFAFSITPTIFFHDLIANHTDSAGNTTGTTKNTIGKKLFNCHCDNIVAESPFTETASIIISPPQRIFITTKAEELVFFSTTQQLSYSLRGPPGV